MEMVAVRGSGRDVACLPLPAPAPGSRPVLLAPAPGDGSADPVARLVEVVADADRMATAVAAFRDELVATAYREGSVEYAARLGHLPEGQRREWGARGMLAELAVAMNVPEPSLARRLARTNALAAFPMMRAAHLAGTVSARHIDVMLDVFAGVLDEDVLARADAALIARATTATASQLRVTARRWRGRHAPRTAESRRRALADRYVAVSPADDDLCWLTALLPAVQAMAIYHRLDDLAGAVAGPDDERTAPQLRADVLAALLLDPEGTSLAADAIRPDGDECGHGSDDTGSGRRAVSAAPGGSHGAFLDDADAPALPGCLRGIRPTVVLTVPVLSLLGHGDEPADLEGFGPIDLETARELVGRASSLIRVLTHPETGAVLSVGRERYRVPADLRTAAELRDETCRFPGCRRRAARCDVDHSTAWQEGGSTALANLAVLCRKHHRLKHQAGWSITHGDGGVLHWRSPTGARHSTAPAASLWPPAPRPPDPDPPPDTLADLGSTTPSTTARTSGYPDVPPF